MLTNNMGILGLSRFPHARVCLHTHTHTRMHAQAHAHTHKHTHTHTHTRTHTHTHTNTRTHARTHARTLAHSCHMHARTRTHAHNGSHATQVLRCLFSVCSVEFYCIRFVLTGISTCISLRLLYILRANHVGLLVNHLSLYNHSNPVDHSLRHSNPSTCQTLAMTHAGARTHVRLCGSVSLCLFPPDAARDRRSNGLVGYNGDIFHPGYGAHIL